MSSALKANQIAAGQKWKAHKRDKITELNAIQSPLLRLPAEIREMIYTHVFRNEIFELDQNLKPDVEAWILNGAVTLTPHDTDSHPQRYPGMELLLASRQIHQEAALHPYKLATFDFGVSFNSGRLVGIGPKHIAMKFFLKERSMAQAEVLARMQVCVSGEQWSPQKALESRATASRRKGSMRKGDGAYWAAELGCQDFFS
ncbi:hypothetical protein J4E83_008050 [Alternaria metachromatica]|uniref:uncharacterized protein n=1 Tax=Alternaria metachromatica TaxID=283354 RepID=UPI0020C52AB6|nr:uncharacterized protein J4E83_008050 [Alternaria metachromatica]KAI4611107.1 hypothetical protein J4E83_008050 [Alternaria metachromatica]